MDAGWKVFCLPVARTALGDPRRYEFASQSRSRAGAVDLGAIAYFDPVPSKDGTKIFAIEELRKGELDQFNQKTAAFAPYLGGITAYYLDFSRDGQSLAYVTYPDQTLWRSNADGSGSVKLTSSPLSALEPRWSPDGKQIVFYAYEQGKPPRLYIVSSDGSGMPEELAPSSPGQQWDPSWSPDGKSVIFGDLPGPRSFIRIVDVNTRQVSVVPGSGGYFSPRWSPDGRYIAALPNGSQGLVLYDFKTEKWSPLAADPAGFPAWSHDSQFVYFLSSQTTEGDGLMRVRISDRKLEQVASLKGFSSAGLLRQLARSHARRHSPHASRRRHRGRGLDGLERPLISFRKSVIIPFDP